MNMKDWKLFKKNEEERYLDKLKIVLPDTDFRLVEWNFTGDWDELREAAEKKREIECVVELQNSMIKDCRVMGVMRWYNIKEEEVKVEEDEDDWDEVI